MPPMEPDHPRPLSALPSVRARLLAFLAIVAAGIFGAMIGYSFVDLQCDGTTLSIEVGNDSSQKTEASFTPRSITERANSIGGKVLVRRNMGRDVVRVTVPLEGRKHRPSGIAA